MVRAPLALVVALAAGCPGPADPPRPIDGPGAGLPPPVIALPADALSPAPPALTPCPAGWREVPGEAPGDATACDPFPAGGARSCPGAQAHFPGEPGCARIGAECPADGWPAALPENLPVRHVRAGATPGGDGTRQAPFDSVGAALAGAMPGTVVAIAVGDYPEAVSIPAGVALWGACAEGTRLACPQPSSLGATLEAREAGASARNLTVGGERPGIRADGEGASIDLRDVLVWEAALSGLRATRGGRIDGERVVVRATRHWPSTGAMGRGVYADLGGEVALRRAAIESNREAGVLAMDPGTLVRLADCSVRGTRAREGDGKRGQGLVAYGGARVEGERMAVEGNQSQGVYAEGPGSVLALDGAVLRDTGPCPDDPDSGAGALCFAGGRLELRRALLERNRASGVMVLDPGSLALLADVVVRDTRETGRSGTLGTGVLAGKGARLEAARVSLEDNRDAGLLILGEGVWAEVADLSVRRTLSLPASGELGLGLHVSGGASLALARAEVADNHHCGALVDAGASLSGSDLRLMRTGGSDHARGGGCGLYAQGGAQVEIRRTLVEGALGGGVAASGAGTRLSATDLVVRDGRAHPHDCSFGRSVHVQHGARLSLVRARVERGAEAGLSAMGAGTRLEAADLEVLDVGPRRCAGAQERFGLGVLSLQRAEVSLARFRIARAARVGLELGGGTARLEDGEVAENPIGVNVQTEGVDPLELLRDVRLRGNGRDLAANLLPLPEPELPEMKR